MIFFKKTEVRLPVYDNSNLIFYFSFLNRSLKYKDVKDILVMLSQAGLKLKLNRGSMHYPGEVLTEQLGFGINNSSGKLLIGNPFHPDCPPAHLVLSVEPQNADVIYSHFLNDIIQLDNFISLFVINAEYFYLQQSLMVEEYKKYNISTAELKYSSNNVLNKKLIDVTKNPGYATVISDTWLMAGWKMWLHAGFFQELTGKDLLDFPYAYASERIDDKIIFLQLYEYQNEPHYRKNRNVQFQFRDWINMDTIIKRDKSTA